MTAGTEVARRPDLPVAAYQPEERTAEDLTLPKLKVGESNTGHVKRKRVSDGDLFTEVSTDDVSPVILAESDGKSAGPVLFYVLAPVRKSYSWNDRDTNEFIVRGFNHPDVQAQIDKYGARGKDKWIPRLGYNYLIALPDHPSPETPYKFLLKGMSSPAARNLETELTKASKDQPFWEVPFELYAEPQSRGDFSFNVFKVSRADIPAKKRQEHIRDIVEPLVNAAHDIATSASVLEESKPAQITDAPDID